jgi:integrase
MITASCPKEKEVKPPKTRRSLRRILIDDETVKMLERRKAISTSEWVFSDKTGGLMSPWWMSKYMRQTTKAAGFEHRSFKSLRHSHITWLLEQGVAVHIVQARAGHAKPSMTLGVYAHVTSAGQLTAVDALNKIGIA